LSVLMQLIEQLKDEAIRTKTKTLKDSLKPVKTSRRKYALAA
jgi:hypothetical protein